MVEKEYIVTHPKARGPLCVHGKTLEDALEKEGLDPAIWKEAGVTPEEEVKPDGDNQGAPGDEDN